MERLGLLRVRRVHLVRHLEERREVVLERDGGEVLLVDGVLALAAAVLRLQEVGKLALRGEEREGVGQFLRDVPLALRKTNGGAVHGDAYLLVGAGHRRGLLRRREVLGAHGRQRLRRPAHAARRVSVEQHAHVLARQGPDAGRHHFLHLVFVGGKLHLGGDAELCAHLVDARLVNAAAPQGLDERLLHLEDALGRKHHVVLARLVDVVVHLPQRVLHVAVVVRLEVHEAGVVVAGRDLVELREADVRYCHCVFSLCQRNHTRVYTPMST